MDIKLGQHALERFNERFPDQVKTVGFFQNWENYSGCPKKKMNSLILFELFKRSKENHSIKNNLGYMINLCDKHNIKNTEDFRIFNNGPIIFLTEQRGNELIIKTVIKEDFRIGRYIPKSDISDFNLKEDKNPDFRISPNVLKIHEYKTLISEIIDNPKLSKIKDTLLNDRLRSFYNPNNKSQKIFFDNNDLKTESYQKISDKINNPTNKKIREIYHKELKNKKDIENAKEVSLMEILKFKLNHFGMEYIATLDNGQSMVYTNNDYVGSHQYKNKLILISQKNMANIMSQHHSSFSSFNAKDMDYLFGVKKPNEETQKKMYMTLLMNASGKHNTTSMSVPRLKEIILDTIPDQIKTEFHVNSKTLNGDVLDNFKHYLLKTDIGLKSFMGAGLMSHDIRDNYIIAPFYTSENKEYTLCLSKHKHTDELFIQKYFFATEGSYKGKLLFNSATMNKEEYLNALERFVEFFDSRTQKQKQESNLGVGNKIQGVSEQDRYKEQIDGKEIYQFIAQELNKYKVFSDILNKVIKEYDLDLDQIINNNYLVKLPKLTKNDHFDEQEIQVKKIDRVFIKRQSFGM